MTKIERVGWTARKREKDSIRIRGDSWLKKGRPCPVLVD